MAFILINYGITCKGISAEGYIWSFLIGSHFCITTHLLALGGLVEHEVIGGRRGEKKILVEVRDNLLV